VNFLRRLLARLVTVLVVVAILVTPAFIPAVQTWAAQSWLSRQAGVQGKIGTLWVGFGFVNVSDLRLEADGAVLTAPSVDLHLPLVTAFRQHRFLIGSVEARGWTLDLSRKAPPAAEGAPSQKPAPPTEPLAQREIEAVQKVAGAAAAALHAWRLPFDATFNGIDLEGDVVLPPTPGGDPVKAHLVLTGGGLHPGHDGAFQVDAEIHDPELPVSPLSVQGTLILAMDTPRTLNRIQLKTELASDEATRNPQPPLSVDAAVTRAAGGDTLAVDLSRETRKLVGLHLQLGADARHSTGTWTADLRDADLSPLFPDHPLPTLAVSGSGKFEAEGAFAKVEATGQLKVAASRLGALEPRLDRLGAVTLEGRFALAREGDLLRITRLEASVGATGRVAEVTALQPFAIDLKAGTFTPADPKADWADLSVPKLPVAWFSYLTDRVTLTGGDVAGSFVLRPIEHGIALRTKAPLTATGLTVHGAGRVLGQGLDLTAPLSAEWSPTQWTLEAHPLQFTRGGRPVVTVDGTASQAAAAGQPLAITARWKADFGALAAGGPEPGPAWLAGRSGSGDLTAKITDSISLDSKFTVEGADPAGKVTANLHLDLDDAGDVAFDGPIKLGTGAETTDVTAKGSWTGEGPGGGLELTLNGDYLDLDRLGALAGPLAASAGIRLPSTAASAPGAPDTSPFWGDWSGHIDGAFGRLKLGDLDLKGAGGALNVRNGFLQLVGGHWMLPHNNLAKLDATVSFDPRSDTPYSVKGTTDLNQVDAAPLFPGTGEEKLPGLEGRFTVTGDLRGSGATFADLLARTQAEFHLTSAGGVLRLLATNVADAIPQASTPVADTLNSVGATVGGFLGAQRGSFESGKNPVSKTADAVINFTYETNEIGYDKIDLTASRGIDGVVRLTHIELDAADEHFVGTGAIAAAPGTPLKARPLSADFTFGFKGHAAELLAKTGLLSGKKDAAGYALLAQPVHLAGTVEHLDTSGWHDLLARAATGKPGPAR
jgi:hypothetical protein